MLGKPQFRSPIANNKGLVGQSWVGWFEKLQSFFSTEPMPLPAFTVATLPTAANFTGYIVFVSDESGGAQPAWSDGANWKRFSDGATVS